jgi:hypothetical protein
MKLLTKKSIIRDSYRFRNWLLKFVSTKPFLTIFLSCALLIIIFSLFFIEFQNRLNSLVVEIFGALLILLIFEFIVIRISSKSSYPKTKTLIYVHLTNTLTNISLDLLHNYLKISTLGLRDINFGLVPGKKFLKVGIEYLSFYNNEKNRGLIEKKYCSLEQSQIIYWRNRINDYKIDIKLFLDNTNLIKPKDEDVSDILQIYLMISQIQSELYKFDFIRQRNKRFFSGYVYSLSKSLINTMKSGLYDHWVRPRNISTVMERSEF